MKGFLKKVQRQVGNSPTNPNASVIDKMDPKPQAALTPSVSGTSIPNSAKRVPGVESTPRADVILPRRERRYL